MLAKDDFFILRRTKQGPELLSLNAKCATSNSARSRTNPHAGRRAKINRRCGRLGGALFAALNMMMIGPKMPRPAGVPSNAPP
jgi:hypothetical protein